jgi:hypothetical protein
VTAESKIAAQVPSPKSSTGGGAYIGGGETAMSAANAHDDNSEAAPAATINFTQRIDFVLCLERQAVGASRPKTHGRPMQIISQAPLNPDF